jgi:signal transduction histidine kinase
MRATVPLLELRRSLRRYRLELLWVAFAVASYSAVVALPDGPTIVCGGPLLALIVVLTLRHGRRRHHELDIAQARAEELERIDAIIDRLLLLATADQPDFLHLGGADVEPFLEDVFMRWSEVAPRAWRLGQLDAGTVAVDPDRLRAALDVLVENAIKYTRKSDAIELRAVSDGPGQLLIEGGAILHRRLALGRT